MNKIMNKLIYSVNKMFRVFAYSNEWISYSRFGTPPIVKSLKLSLLLIFEYKYLNNINNKQMSKNKKWTLKHVVKNII